MSWWKRNILNWITFCPLSAVEVRIEGAISKRNNINRAIVLIKCRLFLIWIPQEILSRMMQLVCRAASFMQAWPLCWQNLKIFRTLLLLPGCQLISYVSAQQVLFRICNSGSHYYKNIKILLKIASGRRFLRY